MALPLLPRFFLAQTMRMHYGDKIKIVGGWKWERWGGGGVKGGEPPLLFSICTKPYSSPFLAKRGSIIYGH